MYIQFYFSTTDFIEGTVCAHGHDIFYTVMQSHPNSLCGDVVLDSVNMAFMAKITLKIRNMKSKYIRNFIMKILI